MVDPLSPSSPSQTNKKLELKKKCVEKNERKKEKVAIEAVTMHFKIWIAALSDKKIKE